MNASSHHRLSSTSGDTATNSPQQFDSDSRMQMADHKDPESARQDAPGPPVDYPEGGLQAWLAVAGAAAVLFCTFGYINAFGIYQDYYSTHQLKDYSQSDIAWIGSVQVFLQFAGGVVGGPLFDKYGNIGLMPASLGYVVSIVLTSFCTKYYQFFLAQAVLGGSCIGIIFSPTLAVISHYFFKKRGAAIGVAVAGSSVGGVVFPIVLNRLLYVHRLSFGWTVRVCALIVLVLLGFAVFVMKPRLPPAEKAFDFALVKRPIYILTIAGIWLMNCGLYVPFFYLPAFSIRIGMSPALAPYMVAILNGTSFFGRILAGVLADRMGRYNMLTTVGAVSSVLLFCWPAIHTSAGVIVFAAFAGFFIGAIVSLLAACVAQITPNPKYMGTLTGISMLMWSFAGLSGPPISGAIVGSQGKFEDAGIFGGAVLAAGAVILFVGRLVGQPKLVAIF